MSKEMTAWDFPIAEIWPKSSAERSTAAVTSVAYFTILQGPSRGVEDRVVRRLDPNPLPAFRHALVFGGTEFASPKAGPEIVVVLRSPMLGRDKHAVMTADYLR